MVYNNTIQMSLSPEEQAKIMEAIRRDQASLDAALMASQNPSYQNKQAVFKAQDKLNNTMLNYGKNIFNDPRMGAIRSFPRTAVLSNGNADLQRGFQEFTLPGEDRAFNVPTALLQKLSQEQNYNAGRTNTLDKYFGTDNKANYRSYGVMRDYFDQASKNPEWQGEGSFNAITARDQRVNDLNTRRQNLLAPTGGTITEQRAVGGKMIGGNAGAVADLDKQMAQINSAGANINSRATARQAHEKNIELGQMMRDLERMKATTSNLPISEKVLR